MLSLAFSAAGTSHGAHTAIVVSQDGGDAPTGADELYCDALGRVRIRYHWQDGGGIGSQFLPHIGQEVVVRFIENDIDRPIIEDPVYNGEGDGCAPTPGGETLSSSSSDDAALFQPAHDHAPSAQGNLADGASLVWHRASAGDVGHRKAASQRACAPKNSAACATTSCCSTTRMRRGGYSCARRWRP